VKEQSSALAVLYGIFSIFYLFNQIEMNTILTSCQDMQKKQIVMQDTVLDKLTSFKNLLQNTKASLAQGKIIIILVYATEYPFY
jgi:hypothetical protein